MTTLNQTSDKTIPWGRRLIDALNEIPRDYVFLVLDDFFACGPIEWKYFDEIVDEMEKDKAIVSFQLRGKFTMCRDPIKYDVANDFEPELIQKTDYKTLFMPTVWRKSVLLKWLRPWESIWAFELCGSARARRWNYPGKVYIVSKPLIYDYLYLSPAYSAILNGKWLDEPEIVSFFDEHGIEVEWSKRGKITKEEYGSVTMNDILKRYSFWQIIIKSINRIRSFF